MVRLTPKQQIAAKYFRIILAIYSILLAACVVVGGYGVPWALGYSVIAVLACFFAGKDDSKIAFRGARLGALAYSVVLIASSYNVFRCFVLDSSKCDFVFTYSAMLVCTAGAIAATVICFRRASARKKEETADTTTTKKRLASYKKLDSLDMDKLKAMAKTPEGFKAPDKFKSQEEKESEKKEKEDKKIFLEGIRERIKQDERQAKEDQ